MLRVVWLTFQNNGGINQYGKALFSVFVRSLLYSKHKGVFARSKLAVLLLLKVRNLEKNRHCRCALTLKQALPPICACRRIVS